MCLDRDLDLDIGSLVPRYNMFDSTWWTRSSRRRTRWTSVETPEPLPDPPSLNLTTSTQYPVIGAGFALRIRYSQPGPLQRPKSIML